MKNPFTSIRLFWGEMLTELKKAAWPTRRELKDHTILVLVATVILGAFIGLIDFSLFQIVNLFTRLVTG